MESEKVDYEEYDPEMETRGTLFEFYDFISVIYFSMTTLSTCGFGDITPQSNIEKVTGVLVMFSGVGFFSYIMGNFISIIQEMGTDFSSYDRTFELNNWMKLLTRFRNNQPLPARLMRQIHTHYKHYWLHNRIRQVQKDNEFMLDMPPSIKRNIIVHFLFDDIFFNFRSFFKPEKLEGSKFLYEVAFGLMPRIFSKAEDENVIYDEEDEVLEMYFVMNGSVGVGYHLFQQPLEKPRYTLVKQLEMNVAFGDFYLFNYRKSEFLFIAVTHVEAFAISREFIHETIYPRYPAIIDQMRDQSKYSYNTNIAYELAKSKAEHVAYINKSHSYEGLLL